MRLFLQVADAVAHAHARLIVHRDLKPSDILVSALGEVKLLDFGVAKLLEGETPAAANLTQQLGRAVTPDYASPEQMADRAVTVATDVYSLGVVLYELLTGQRPYRVERAGGAPLEDAIAGADATLASTRVGSEHALARQLRGDLDTIIDKALRKDPAQRYASVESMAADVRRHLQGQPVWAQPQSRRYRAGKFVRRHRLALVAAAGAVASLLLGLGAALWQAREARTQAAAAQREAQRAQGVQDMLLSIFRANSVQQPDPVRARQTTARDLLDIGAARATSGLQGSPAAQDAVLDTLADMYVQLELAEQGARLRLQRVEALKKEHGKADARVAGALLSYAEDLGGTEQPLRAVQALAEARRILDAAGDHSSSLRGWVWLSSTRWQQYLSLPAMRDDAAAALHHFEQHPGSWTDRFHAQQAVARASFIAGDFVAAAAGHLAAIELAEQQTNGPSAWSITPLVQRAEAQIASLEFDAAERNLRAALALAGKLNGERAGATLQTQAKLGAFLHATGRRDEGARLVSDALAALERPDARATPDAVDTVRRTAGRLAHFDGHSAQALPALETQVAELHRQLPGSLPLARTLLLQAAPLVVLGRYDAADRALQEAWQLWLAFSADAADAAEGNRFRLERARLELARGDAAAALAALPAVVSPHTASTLALRVDETRVQVLRAQAFVMQERAGDAEALAAQALAQLQASPLRARFVALEAEAALRLGQARQRGGRAAVARAPLQHALALRQANEAADSPRLAEAQVALAECLIDLNERKAAQTLLAQARAIHAAHAELAMHFKQALAGASTRLRHAVVSR